MTDGAGCAFGEPAGTAEIAAFRLPRLFSYRDRGDPIYGGMANQTIVPSSVPFRVTICGIAELAEHCAMRITHVLSILDPGCPEPEALGVFDRHARLELRFHDIIDPEPAAILPARDDIVRLLAFGRTIAAAEHPHLLVHCHAGISRSTAATVVILAQAWPERPAAVAFDTIFQLRPKAWPNLRIIELGDDLLDRRGALIEAAAAHYRRAIEHDPLRAEIMIAGGRSREVAAAKGG